MSLDSIFDTRASLALTAFFITWVAVALLSVIAVHLHLRVVRLERASLASNRGAPYAHLIGQRADVLFRGSTDAWQPAFVLFVSSSCAVCERILEEVNARDWPASIALAWVDAVPSPPPRLVPGVRILPDGATIGAALGIRTTPFALIVDDEGRIARAMPINSLEPLTRAVWPRLSASPAREAGRALEEAS
jgi:hypothetical protein